MQASIGKMIEWFSSVKNKKERERERDRDREREFAYKKIQT